MWLRTHRFPLFVFDGYTKTFFPRPKKSTTELPKPSTEHVEALRVYISADSVNPRGDGGCDIYNILSYIERFPGCKIELVGAQGIPAVFIDSLTALVRNDNATWRGWIKDRSITQVRVERALDHTTKPGNVGVRIVFSQQKAPEWVRLTPWTVGKEQRNSFGLGGDVWEIRLGLCY